MQDKERYEKVGKTLVYTCVSAGGLYGCASPGSDRPASLRDLTVRLDLLGISAAVTSHALSFSQNATLGNMQLLSDLSTENSLRERIIPCFYLTPEMQFGDGEMDFLTGCLQNGSVRCVVLRPDARRPLTAFQAMLSKIQVFQPAVFLEAEYADPLFFHQLSETAKEFPELRLIVTGVRDSELVALCGAMDGHNNIAAGISHLTFRGAAAALARRYGAGRLVFSSVSPACGGGAYAALAFSGLPAGQIRDIAGGNIAEFIRIKDLLQYAPGQKTAAEFLAHGRVDGISPADAFCPVGPSPGGLAAQIVESAQLLELMQCHGSFGGGPVIAASVSAAHGGDPAGNRSLEACAKAFPECKGFFVCSSESAGGIRPDVLFDCFHRGFFKGLALFSDPAAEVFVPALEFAHRHRLPVVLWSQNGAFCDPCAALELSGRYPFSAFIMHGLAESDLYKAADAMRSAENIYADTGGLCIGCGFEKALDILPAERLLYASGGFENDPYRQIGRLVFTCCDREKINGILEKNLHDLLQRSGPHRS